MADMLLTQNEFSILRSKKHYLENLKNVQILLPTNIREKISDDFFVVRVIGGTDITVESLKKYLRRAAQKECNFISRPAQSPVVITINDSFNEKESSPNEIQCIDLGEEAQKDVKGEHSIEMQQCAQGSNKTLNDSDVIVLSDDDEKPTPSLVNLKPSPIFSKTENFISLNCSSNLRSRAETERNIASTSTSQNTSAQSSIQDESLNSSIIEIAVVPRLLSSDSKIESIAVPPRSIIKNTIPRVIKKRVKRRRPKTCLQILKPPPPKHTRIDKNLAHDLHHIKPLTVKTRKKKVQPLLRQSIECLAIVNPSIPLVRTPQIRRLRPIVIDGSNVAIAHGIKEDIFSSEGIKIAIEYFEKRGHTEITAFVPRHRQQGQSHSIPTVGHNILQELYKTQRVVFTPSKCYDDRFMIQLAQENGGVILSNDNFLDLRGENEQFANVIDTRLVGYCFVGNMLMLPQDPKGRYGPKLDDVLAFPS